MKRLLVTMLIGWSAAAHADVPPGVTQRLVRFILDGCDYLSANSPNPPTPEPPDKKLAAHFGRVIKTRKRGIGIEYVLKVRSFDDWEVAYWFRGIDLKPPPTVAITMGDLQRFFGPDEALDVDYAVSTTSTGSEIKVDERAFDTHREDVCRVTVQTEADLKKGAARRVFSVRVAD